MYNERLEKMLEEYKEAEKFQKLDGGTKDLLSSYYKSKDINNISNTLVIEDIVWDYDLEDFAKALNEYNINELIVSSSWSSSAIQVIMYLVENGYEVAGTKIYNDKKLFGDRIIRKGLLLIKK